MRPDRCRLIDIDGTIFHDDTTMRGFTQYDRGGFAPIIGLVLIGAVGLVAGSGYVLVRSGRLPVPSVNLPTIPFLSRGVSEKDFAGIEDPILRKHFATQSNANEVRRITHVDDQSSVTVEQEGKGNTVRIHAWETYGEDVSGEIIVTGPTVFVKDDTDGAWWKQEVGESATADLPANMRPYTPADLANKQDLSFVQQEQQPCGQSQCYVYKETNPANSFATRTFWVDTKTHLLIKEEISFGELTTTVEYQYNDIAVSAPTPTKDVPEGEHIFAYLSTPTADTLIRFEEDADAVQTSANQFQQQFEERLQKQFEERLQRQLEERLQQHLQEQISSQLGVDVATPTPTTVITPTSGQEDPAETSPTQVSQ